MWSGRDIDHLGRDRWQVQCSGTPPNADAVSTADPDGDGQRNLFEFLAGAVTSDNGGERTVADPNAGGTRKSYHVDISRP